MWVFKHNRHNNTAKPPEVDLAAQFCRCHLRRGGCVCVGVCVCGGGGWNITQGYSYQQPADTSYILSIKQYKAVCSVALAVTDTKCGHCAVLYVVRQMAGQMHGEWRCPTAHTVEESRHHLHTGAILRKTKGKIVFLSLPLILFQYRMIMAEIVGRYISSTWGKNECLVTDGAVLVR
jgi:hypothetical protein